MLNPVPCINPVNISLNPAWGGFAPRDKLRFQVGFRPGQLAVHAGFVYSPHVDLSTNPLYVDDTLYGARVALLMNRNWDSSYTGEMAHLVGVEVGFLGNMTKTVKGLQVGIVNNWADRFKGVQLALFSNQAKEESVGMQISIGNLAYKITGVQLGILGSVTRYLSGVQTGLSVVNQFYDSLFFSAVMGRLRSGVLMIMNYEDEFLTGSSSDTHSLAEKQK